MLEQPKPYTKVAADIIVRKDGKILMGKRCNDLGHGTWNLPGGHLEYDEHIEAAAHRELAEETGLTADLKLINITNDLTSGTNGRHYIHFVFEAENIQGEPRIMEPDVCEKWEWFAPDDLPKEIFFGQQKVLESVLNNRFFVE